MQRALLQWKRPEKRALVIEALKSAGREDLIGFGKNCLVRPNSPAKNKKTVSGNNSKVKYDTKKTSKTSRTPNNRTTKGKRK